MDDLNKIPAKIFNLWYGEENQSYYLMTITCGVVKLNIMAAYIWSLIDGKSSIEKIGEIVYDKFPDVEWEQILKDVLKTVYLFEKFEVITFGWKSLEEELL